MVQKDFFIGQTHIKLDDSCVREDTDFILRRVVSMATPILLRHGVVGYETPENKEVRRQNQLDVSETQR